MIPVVAKAAVAVTAAVTLAAGAAVAATTTASPAALQAQFDACVAMRAQAVTLDEQAWAEKCVALAQRALAAAPTPTQSPTVVPSSTPPASPTPTASPTPSSSPTKVTGFPTATSVGVPVGWVPQLTRSTWTISQPGVYTDVRVNGDIQIRATGVVLRRVQVVGGLVNNEASGRCYSFTIEDSSVVQPPGSYTNAGANGVIGPGGYTARRVAIIDRVEGFRVGGKSSGCGPVSIEDSYARVTPPRPCGDWHGDGIQGYDAPPAIYRNVTLELIEDACGGTAPFFYAAAGNSPLVVDRMLVSGGGYAFRMDTAGQVTGLRVVDGTWSYGPIEYDTTCSRATVWQDNAISDPLGNALRPITC